MRLFLLLFLTMSLILSCAHHQGRIPAGDGDNMSNEERARVFLNENPDVSKEESYVFKFFLLLDNIVRAQSLVNNFDMRINSIDNDRDLTRLMGSNLYCKLQRTRQLQDSVEEKVLEFFQEKSSHYDLIRAYDFYRRRTQINEMALGNFARELANHGIDVQYGLMEKGRSNYDPFDDEEALSFREEYIRNMSVEKGLRDSDLEPGECLKGKDGRVPNSAGFDWNRNHWIRSNTKDGEFVITYDDGPHGSYTNAIMDVWNDTNEPKPGMFWLAKNAKRYKSIVHKAHREGFFVAVHSYSHCDLGNLAKASSWGKMSSLNRRCFGSEESTARRNFGRWKANKLSFEIGQAVKDVEGVVKEIDSDFRVKHFRLPFGSGVKSRMIGDQFVKAKVDHYFWKVDSLDWQDKNPRSIIKRVKKQMQVGRRGLVLFHDIQKQTIEASKLLIREVQGNRNWKFVPLSQMEH